MDAKIHINFIYLCIDFICWNKIKSSLSLHQRKRKDNNNH